MILEKIMRMEVAATGKHKITYNLSRLSKAEYRLYVKIVLNDSQ